MCRALDIEANGPGSFACASRIWRPQLKTSLNFSYGHGEPVRELRVADGQRFFSSGRRLPD
jgi:hypothetical protein